MKWMKEVILDIFVTILILVAAIFSISWLIKLLLVYTVVVIIAKIIALYGDFSKASKLKAPELFFHVIYGINVVILLIFNYWILAILWGVVWGLSYLFKRKLKRYVSTKKKRR